VSLDEIETRQINTRKRLVFYMPFFELPLCKPQMEDLQTILHLNAQRVSNTNTAEKKKKKKRNY
jgi:hypothetical protein